jgi:SAM-dependent methyltransferase
MSLEMPDRARARQLAAEYYAKGDPTGWFEQLYREAEEGKSTVPWADHKPSSVLLDFCISRHLKTDGRSALTVGCGFGDDAEQLAALGFATTAFDISESAIRACRKRFPQSCVHYVAADLLNPPADWSHSFDFVFESNTFQVLPRELRARAMERVAEFVRPGGTLFLIARARDENDSPGKMPWPLTRLELNRLVETGLHELSVEEFYDAEDPPVRRVRASYVRPGSSGVE